MDSGLVRKDSMKVLDKGGSAFSSDCCSSTSDFSLTSSYQVFRSRPLPGVDASALAMAIAAEAPPAPPPAAGVAVPDLAAWMAALSASLIASASARAVEYEVKEKTCVSGAVVPGAWAKIFSITFGLLAGVCWRSRG